MSEDYTYTTLVNWRTRAHELAATVNTQAARVAELEAQLNAAIDAAIRMEGVHATVCRENIALRAKLDAVPVDAIAPDWGDAPRWAQWWAVDCDGEAYWFEAEPVRCSSVWDSSAGGMSRMLACGYTDVDKINWRTSLIQRPRAVQP